MSASQDAMNTLSAQWYNALTTGLGLDPGHFQLIQGAVPVGPTSAALWQVFDSVPPATATTLFNPAQINSFSQDYAGIISALIPQGFLQFQKDMGDSYTTWNNAKKTLNPMPSTTMGWIQAFTNWANANLDQSMVSPAITDYKTTLLDPISVAANQLTQVQFATSNANVYAYNTTANQLSLALASAQSKSFTLDSSTTSSNISNTWAKAEASGLFDIFSLGGNSSYQSLSSKVTDAGVKVSGQFSKVVTLAAGPLQTPSNDSTLQNYTPWFNSAALNAAYQTRDNTVWKSGNATSWNSSFGPSGNLQRLATALLIVDGISITTTSKAGLATADQSSFSAAVSGGVWPFFSASGSGGWSNSASYDDQGNVTTTTTCPAGNPQILGVLVSGVEAIL